MKAYKMIDNKKVEVALKALLVYDKATGTIVHRHWYQEGGKAPIDKERVIKLVSPSRRNLQLEVLSITSDQMHPEKKYHINPATNLLEELQ